MKNILKVNGRVKILPLFGLTLLPLLGGGIIAYITRNAEIIYRQLEKPVFAPPFFVVMIILTISYILMGFASYRIYMIRDEGKDIGASLFFYMIQLLLNYFWPLIFFSFRLFGLAYIELGILFIFIIITFVKFIKLDKIAGFLLISYIIGIGFIGVLNFLLWMKNEM